MSRKMLRESNFLSRYCLVRGKYRRGECLFREIDFHIWMVLQLRLVSDQLNFNPKQTFDETKHQLDTAALEYLGKAANDVRHLVPAEVAPDGNCLYHSIVLLMDTTVVTASELRGMTIRFLSMEVLSLSRNVSVRTVIELVKMKTTMQENILNSSDQCKMPCSLHVKTTTIRSYAKSVHFAHCSTVTYGAFIRTLTSEPT